MRHPIQLKEWQWELINASGDYRDEQFHKWRGREGELENAIQAAGRARAKRIAEGRPRVD